MYTFIHSGFYAIIKIFLGIESCASDNWNRVTKFANNLRCSNSKCILLRKIKKVKQNKKKKKTHPLQAFNNP